MVSRVCGSISSFTFLTKKVKNTKVTSQTGKKTNQLHTKTPTLPRKLCHLLVKAKLACCLNIVCFGSNTIFYSFIKRKRKKGEKKKHGPTSNKFTTTKSVYIQT